ncbi:twin-arginine translocase subunit TatC [soil metagenome]
MTLTAPRPNADGGDAFDGQMTLLEHLEELRSRLFKAALAIAVAFAIGLLFRGALFDILIGPYCDLPPEVRGGTGIFDVDRCALIVTNPLGAFFVTLKAAAVLAIVLAAPPVCYQLWRFITPGLNPSERRYALPFVMLTFVLFAGGAVFAYLIIPRGLEFLVGFAGEDVVPLLDADEYMTFLLKTMMGFGLSFLAPLVIAMLTLAGILTAATLRRYRRHAIFGAFVLSAIITPTQDPITMTMMGGPLVIFFECNIVFARLLERRRGRAAQP